MAAQLLLKEVEESMSQENLKAFWDEWGSTIIGVALMVILGTIVGVGWQSWRNTVYEGQTTELIRTQTDLSMPTDNLKGEYRGIAAMMSAASLAESEGTSPVIAGLMQEAANSGMPHQWEILAEWNNLRALTATEGTDKLQIARDMADLGNSRNNPYQSLILMEAGILAGENGDSNAANQYLNQAMETQAAKDMPNLQSQIQNYLSLYETDATS